MGVQPRDIGLEDDVRASRGPSAVVDDSPAAGVLQLVGVLGLGVLLVERDADESGLGERVVRREALDAVGKHHADAVPRLESLGDESIADAVGGRVELPERQGPVPRTPMPVRPRSAERSA